MTQLEHELQSLKDQLIQMWNLVHSQLENSRISLTRFDQGLAREIIQKEKRVNGYELKIDMDCENILALYCPVAVDLRFVLAVLKINYNLERVGDYAEGIARYVVGLQAPFDEDVLNETQLLEMMNQAIHMLESARYSFEHEDTNKARSVFKEDEMLDNINWKSGSIIYTFVGKNPHYFQESLYIHSIIQKLERIGDQVTNIAEEIIFYLEAKVLKHKQEK